MIRSNFSPLGLPLGESNVNMTFLYGLSDFFTVMFENPDRIDLALEAQTLSASEIYSKFLQVSSQISLESIQEKLGQTMTLVTLKDSDAVFGEVNTYKLPVAITESRFVANRPLLPTSLLEDGVDFSLEISPTGDYWIRLAQPLTDLGFPTRVLQGGVVNEYALWFVDSQIDEMWISKHYGELIGLDPQRSSEMFKNYVYGLYYVYSKGPTLDLMRKGLNLTLGIPLCRGEETVLDIRTYLETDQYIVVTDLNQYLIPFGLTPIVEIGQALTTSDELAQWVEVKDYMHDGDWWINLHIPPNIIPSMPAGQPNRYASAGSHFDELMRNYLKKHTFLVKVKVSFFKDVQVFQQLSDVINRAKPAYTEPIYIWTIETINEEINVSDEVLKLRLDQFRCDHITLGIDKFVRNNQTDPLKRGCPTFIRYNAPAWMTQISGRDAYMNGDPFSYNGGTVTGFINSVTQYRVNTDTEKVWIRTIHERASEVCTRTRSMIGFTRSIFPLPNGLEINGLPINEDVSVGSDTGITVHSLHEIMGIPRSMKIHPMYIINQKDLELKCALTGEVAPTKEKWYFKLWQPKYADGSINAFGINVELSSPITGVLKTHYENVKERGTTYSYLGNEVPAEGYKQWNPPMVENITDHDFVAGVRILNDSIALYFVTYNSGLDFGRFQPVEPNDPLRITFSSKPSRGAGPTSSSFYVVRGRGELDYNSNIQSVNSTIINSSSDGAALLINNNFSDLENTTPRLLTRGGDIITHRLDSL